MAALLHALPILRPFILHPRVFLLLLPLLLLVLLLSPSSSPSSSSFSSTILRTAPRVVVASKQIVHGQVFTLTLGSVKLYPGRYGRFSFLLERLYAMATQSSRQRECRVRCEPRNLTVWLESRTVTEL